MLAKMRGNAKKFSEKLVQVHTAYQNLGKRCQMIEQEIESLSKEKQELQEKFSENSRAVYIFFFYHVSSFGQSLVYASCTLLTANILISDRRERLMKCMIN